MYYTILALCFAPFAWMVYSTLSGRYVDPTEALLLASGTASLQFLALTLAVTPLRRWFKGLAGYRRTLGLMAFFYATVHFAVYLLIDQGADIDDIIADIIKRTFIAVGVVTWLLLLPLALTSINKVIKWMGAANWKRLHKLVYLIVALAMLHFYQKRAGKHNFDDVILYGSLIGVLLCTRIKSIFERKSK